MTICNLKLTNYRTTLTHCVANQSTVTQCMLKVLFVLDGRPCFCNRCLGIRFYCLCTTQYLVRLLLYEHAQYHVLWWCPGLQTWCKHHCLFGSTYSIYMVVCLLQCSYHTTVSSLDVLIWNSSRFMFPCDPLYIKDSYYYSIDDCTC